MLNTLSMFALWLSNNAKWAASSNEKIAKPLVSYFRLASFILSYIVTTFFIQSLFPSKFRTQRLHSGFTLSVQPAFIKHDSKTLINIILPTICAILEIFLEKLLGGWTRTKCTVSSTIPTFLKPHSAVKSTHFPRIVKYFSKSWKFLKFN